MTYQQITLYTDGGARGNPGPAAIGVDAHADGQPLFQLSESLGSQTNNAAEYYAVIKALEKLQTLNLITIKLLFVLDSELIVRQLQGRYRVKEANLKLLHQQVLELLSQLRPNFQVVSFTHVLRSANKVADRLVNQALDSHR